MRSARRPPIPHRWRVSRREAVAIQEALRVRVRLEPLAGRPRLVAGADVAYSPASGRLYAAVVVVALDTLETVETAHVARRACFSYLPGLFAFRELPALLGALRRLRTRPDVLLFDGQGIAHPRRFGLACHAGVLLERPAVGCAKSLLVGEHGRLGPERGARAALRVGGETLGAALRTREGVKPVYVSPGHLVDVDSAVALVLAASGRFRIPEPLRLAHQAATRARLLL